MFDDLLHKVLFRRFAIHGHRRERIARLPLHTHFDIELTDGEVDDVADFEDRGKFLLQNSRIFGSDTEGNDGADISKHGCAHKVTQLSHVLMRDCQREFVLARFTQNFRECIGGKILELVAVKVKRLTISFRHICTLECRLLNLRDHHGAKERCVLLTEEPFIQLHEENLLPIHDFTDIKGVKRLSDDVADQIRTHELPNFIQEGSNRFVIELLAPRGKFVHPEVFYDAVLDPAHDRLPVVLIREHLQNRQYGCAFAIEEREGGLSQQEL